MDRGAMRWLFGTYVAGLLAVLPFAPVYAQPDDRALRSEVTSLTVGFSDKIFYDVDVNSARAITEVWIRTLIKSINRTVGEPGAGTMVFSDLSSIVEALHAGSVDLLILLPLEYLEIRKKGPVECLLTGVTGGPYEYVLLAHRHSGLRELRQLAGKKRSRFLALA